MPKQNPLAQGLSLSRAAAVETPTPRAVPTEPRPAKAARSRTGAVLIGGHFAPEVQTALKILAAEERSTVQKLLAEGINTVFAKRGKPEIAGLNAGQN